MALFSAPVFADATGDAAAGEAVFSKCRACHMITDADGNNIQNGGRTGPNLYGILGRAAASEDFRYGDSLVQAGEAGLVWNEEEFLKYVADPKEYLETYLDKSRARSNMAFRLRDETEALDVWAYLVSVGPAAAEEGAEEATPAADG